MYSVGALPLLTQHWIYDRLCTWRYLRVLSLEQILTSHLLITHIKKSFLFLRTHSCSERKISMSTKNEHITLIFSTIPREMVYIALELSQRGQELNNPLKEVFKIWTGDSLEKRPTHRHTVISNATQVM